MEKDKDKDRLFLWNSRNLSKQLLFDSGSLSPGQQILVDLGLGAAVGGMRIEINTGYSCSFLPGAVFFP